MGQGHLRRSLAAASDMQERAQPSLEANLGLDSRYCLLFSRGQIVQAVQAIWGQDYIRFIVPDDEQE